MKITIQILLIIALLTVSLAATVNVKKDFEEFKTILRDTPEHKMCEECHPDGYQRKN